ncbi:MAG: UDP-N-acetylmuramoyl-tripeptide--D-alanyl-D-alanine ligase [Spirochaetaceae bacterium]|nr:UDP-N-acetylmuramoyl-tripeptide--D-alanyl-D-alanine ligase [Spirochaetaceae bacterium]
MTEAKKALFTVSSAALMSRGVFVSTGKFNPEIFSVAIDSRKVDKGSLFIALKGEITDGHMFISHALKAGASGVMVSNQYYSDLKKNPDSIDSTVCLIVVKDTLAGLQSLSSSWVDSFNKLVRVAVTGSNGKSTTKEMIGSILSENGSTIINKGNLNSETGLPLSVLKINDYHKYGVFEMGINHPGEMKALVSVFKPQYAVITNIGTAHIGFMGSQKDIAKEKADVFACFNEDNTAFIYENDSWVDYLSELCPGKTVRFGVNSTRGIENVIDLGLEGWLIHYRGIKIRLKLIGFHNLNNAAAAISLADFLGIGTEQIKIGLEKIKAMKGRSEIISGPVTIIEDSYNANAESMDRIFSFIKNLQWRGRVVLVLGSMKELGASSSDIHKIVGIKAAELNPDMIYFYGEEMEDAFNAAAESFNEKNFIYISEYSELKTRVVDFLKTGDLVLLKGSRSMGLNNLADEILKLKETACV